VMTRRRHRRVPGMGMGMRPRTRLTQAMLVVLDELLDRWPGCSAMRIALAFADRTGRAISRETVRNHLRNRVAETVGAAPEGPSEIFAEIFFGFRPGSPTER
jgi:hypothetical protein